MLLLYQNRINKLNNMNKFKFNPLRLIEHVRILWNKSFSQTGNTNQVLSWNEQGEPEAKTFNPDMWSDFPGGAPTSGQWVAAAQFDTTEQPQMGFVEVSIGGAQEYKIPFYNDGGKLDVAFAEFPENAVPLAQVDAMIADLQAQITALQT